MTRPVRIAVLGATGSLGQQTLDVISAFPERFQLVGLSAATDDQTMARLAGIHQPEWLVMADPPSAGRLRERLPDAWRERVLAGPERLDWLARSPDVELVVITIVGRAGLPAVTAAVAAGKRIALANKESLVMAGSLIVPAARASGAQLLPVDSEHAGLSLLLQAVGEDASRIQRVILTASGGPFLGYSEQRLEAVKPVDALRHPNWEMGAKVSVDSATMINKGFELIEASWLFGLPMDKIEVVIQPESVAHAVLELNDGSSLMQMGPTDMRGPIASALAHPERLDLPARLSGYRPPDLTELKPIRFLPVTAWQQQALDLCRLAAGLGHGAEAALVAADEVMVDAFLQGRIRFSGILPALEQVLAVVKPREIRNMSDVQAAAMEGERMARERLGSGAQA